MKEYKDNAEIEQAYQLSQMPKAIKVPGSHIQDNREGYVRTLEEFMQDQINYEQRRYENLKNAILKEEAAEENLFQPQITQKSIQILNKKGANINDSTMKKMRRQQEYISQVERENAKMFKPTINKSS